jgi:hypothetical protein
MLSFNYFHLDLAISAPYADGGVVYVYFGMKARSLSKFVVVKPSSFQSHIPTVQIQGFGATIFGNVDLDGNGTPGIMKSDTITIKFLVSL